MAHRNKGSTQEPDWPQNFQLISTATTAPAQVADVIMGGPDTADMEIEIFGTLINTLIRKWTDKIISELGEGGAKKAWKEQKKLSKQAISLLDSWAADLECWRPDVNRWNATRPSGNPDEPPLTMCAEDPTELIHFENNLCRLVDLEEQCAPLLKDLTKLVPQLKDALEQRLAAAKKKKSKWKDVLLVLQGRRATKEMKLVLQLKKEQQISVDKKAKRGLAAEEWLKMGLYQAKLKFISLQNRVENIRRHKWTAEDRD